MSALSSRASSLPAWPALKASKQSSSAEKRLRMPFISFRSTDTFMPAQKATEDLWSHVYTMQLRTCLRFGAVSSILVAFRILIASSPSDLNRHHISMQNEGQAPKGHIEVNRSSKGNELG